MISKSFSQHLFQTVVNILLKPNLSKCVYVSHNLSKCIYVSQCKNMLPGYNLGGLNHFMIIERGRGAHGRLCFLNKIIF